MAEYEITINWNGTFDVRRDGERVRSGFETEDDAQRWIDDQTD